jgi:hypothetical protein
MCSLSTRADISDRIEFVHELPGQYIFESCRGGLHTVWDRLHISGRSELVHGWLPGGPGRVRKFLRQLSGQLHIGSGRVLYPLCSRIYIRTWIGQLYCVSGRQVFHFRGRLRRLPGQHIF